MNGSQYNPEMIGRAAERLRALADERRIMLLLRLQDGEANVSTLAAACGLGLASASKHLASLKQVGLIDSRRAGTQTVYRVSDPSVFDLCDIVCDGVRRHARRQHEAVLGPALDEVGAERRSA
jgi:DNA-binding transcriptional ArsR family regulator